MEESTLYFQIWNNYAGIAAYVFVGLAAAIVIFHVLRLISLTDLKRKYDYINQYEIRLLWYSSVALIIGAGFYANTLFAENGTVWFLVRIFVSLMIGLILGVIVSNVLRFYYPFFVEKRLKKLRFTPRLTPEGKPMTLLSEDEEDVYLDEGMQAEENVFSVDYDVWIDKETGYTKIEKYSGHLHAQRCPECNYQTLKVVREKIIESPEENRGGQLMKFFKCDYCGYKERKTYRIAKLSVAARFEESNKALSSM